MSNSKNKSSYKFSKPMRVAVFFSGGASSLKYLLENDSNLNKKYQIVVAFTDNPQAAALNLVKQADIQLIQLDFHNWCRQNQVKFNDLKARQNYFRQISHLIKPFKPDIIMLSGFMLLITEPLLTKYQNRILNVHPADLTILNQQGKRKYTGIDAVAQAISAGEKSTRSTIHLVTAEIDNGPIVTLSDPLIIEHGSDAKTHQEKMKWACDGPAYARALTLLSSGQIFVA